MVALIVFSSKFTWVFSIFFLCLIFNVLVRSLHGNLEENLGSWTHDNYTSTKILV